MPASAGPAAVSGAANGPAAPLYRPLKGAWTPDQQLVADAVSDHRRVVVASANGVGKTYLCADLLIAWMSRPDSLALTTAPTRRQVNDSLWNEIWTRLIDAGLAKPDASGTRWADRRTRRRLIGMATDRAPRLQGLHAAHVMVVVDEASGFRIDLLNALEAIAIGATDRIVLIGNPNNQTGALWEAWSRPSYTHLRLSAMTHPNILERREVVPGATSWTALTDRLADWCTIIPPDAPPQPDELTIDAVRYAPNDEFRVRYLGLWPRTPAGLLISQADLDDATTAALTGYSIAAVDVARYGGDDTVYAVRDGDTCTRCQVLAPADLITQSNIVAGLLRDDGARAVIVDAAGLGAGMLDSLVGTAPCPVIRFVGSDKPISPQHQARYLNMRAFAYAMLARALRDRRCALPIVPELREELLQLPYSFNEHHQMRLAPKDAIKAQFGRSPDRADAVSMLWSGLAAQPTAITQPVRRDRDEDDW